MIHQPVRGDDDGPCLVKGGARLPFDDDVVVAIAQAGQELNALRIFGNGGEEEMEKVGIVLCQKLVRVAVRIVGAFASEQVGLFAKIGGLRGQTAKDDDCFARIEPERGIVPLQHLAQGQLGGRIHKFLRPGWYGKENIGSSRVVAEAALHRRVGIGAVIFGVQPEVALRDLIALPGELGDEAFGRSLNGSGHLVPWRARRTRGVTRDQEQERRDTPARPKFCSA